MITASLTDRSHVLIYCACIYISGPQCSDPTFCIRVQTCNQILLATLITIAHPHARFATFTYVHISWEPLPPSIGRYDIPQISNRPDWSKHLSHNSRELMALPLVTYCVANSWKPS